MSGPIRLDDRISAVLARDARMLDVLLGASPAFAHLRNPVVRKTMAKLATVEHTARVAGIDAEDLLARLNGALAGAPATAAPARHVDAPADYGMPPDVQSRAIVECDVREDLRAGREPFRRILAAARAVGDAEVLRLRAIFEPAPLYGVLARQGYAHFTERLADDDWCVWFWRGPGVQAAAAAPPPSVAVETGEDVIVIDVRGLEPPEPLMRTLAALDDLPHAHTLVQVNARVPQFLLPVLADRGYACEIDESHPDRGLVRIWRPASERPAG